MRLRELLRESWRDMVSGMGRSLLLFVGISSLTCCLIGFDLMQIIAIEHRVIEYRDTGSNIAMVVKEKGINGEACMGMTRSGSVESAGALRAAGDVSLTALPHNPIPTFEVTPGIPPIIPARVSRGGVWVPRQMATNLGLAVGSDIATDRGELHVAGIYAWPEDGRDARMGYAIIVPVADSGSFDECWARTSTSREEIASLLRYAVSYDAGLAEVQVGQLNYAKGDWVDGYRLFSARSSRFVMPLSGLLALLLAYGCVRRRKLELSGNLHAGCDKAAQMVQLIVEQFVPTVMAVFVSLVGMSVVLMVSHAPEAMQLIQVACHEALCIPVGAVLGTMFGGVTIHERDLFRYFKSRA